MTQEHQERRIDPENRMSIKDFHAPRALGRNEFEGLTGEKRREAIKNPKTRFREGDEMRTILLGMLDRIEGVRNPEQQQLLDNLMGQRDEAASVWTEKFHLKGAPSKDKLIVDAEKWLQSLSSDVLQGFIELCPNSTQLVVVPGKIATPKLLQSIDKNKTIEDQIGSKIWWPEGWDKVKADNWKFGITDAREDLPFDPSIYYFNPNDPEGERKERTNEQMVAEYKRRFSEKKLGIMPQHGYVPTAGNRLASGNVLDRKFWTAFERPTGAAFLPSARWYDDLVDLSSGNPDDSRDNLRCRPWFEGEM